MNARYQHGEFGLCGKHVGFTVSCAHPIIWIRTALTHCPRTFPFLKPITRPRLHCSRRRSLTCRGFVFVRLVYLLYVLYVQLTARVWADAKMHPEHVVLFKGFFCVEFCTRGCLLFKAELCFPCSGLMSKNRMRTLAHANVSIGSFGRAFSREI